MHYNDRRARCGRLLVAQIERSGPAHLPPHGEYFPLVELTHTQHTFGKATDPKIREGRVQYTQSRKTLEMGPPRTRSLSSIRWMHLPWKWEKVVCFGQKPRRRFWEKTLQCNRHQYFRQHQDFTLPTSSFVP